MTTMAANAICVRAGRDRSVSQSEAMAPVAAKETSNSDPDILHGLRRRVVAIRQAPCISPQRRVPLVDRKASALDPKQEDKLRYWTRYATEGAAATPPSL